MSNNLNLNKCQSKTLREYYIKFIEIKDPCIGNGWGWFVDLDLQKSTPIQKSRPIQIIQNYKSYINEYPRIRSTKSITNLYQMNNKNNNKINNKINNKMNLYKYTNFICINLIGIIMFTIIYYIK